MKEYEFQEQLNNGKAEEETLDRYFSNRYKISKVSLDEERARGIDRRYASKQDNVTYTVEYKADWTATSTGNAFIETISNDENNTPGWCLKSEAQLLMYYLPDDKIVYIVDMLKMKGKLRKWRKIYPKKMIPNKVNGRVAYRTHGYCVPLKEIESVCSSKINIDDILS